MKRNATNKTDSLLQINETDINVYIIKKRANNEIGRTWWWKKNFSTGVDL